jgi:hypothetical protein
VVSPEDRAVRGVRYAELLRSGEVTEALDSIADQYADAWANCFDPHERENLWRFVQVVRKIKAQFGVLAGDGKLATYQISEAKRLK